MNMNSRLLSLRGLKVPRGAVRELTHEFGAGVHVIVGPNGIGKTSLLECIAGTLPPAAGAVLLEGREITGGSARVVLAPNAPPPIPWIRAGLLLEFIVSLYPATRRESAYAADVLGRFGLGLVLDSQLGTLSAGTARKLLLAAALIAAPPVLLFDEPTNEIDAASIEAFRQLVAEAAAQRVVLITTHHAGDLESLQPTLLQL
jgi:ABC-2 type transport system ATP-binding protein